MARTKIDGVIESVRYEPDGTIQMARGYERRGAVWTDEILFDREHLIEALKQGRHFVTGARKQYQGGVFDICLSIQLTGGHIVTEGHPSGRDYLDGAGTF